MFDPNYTSANAQIGFGTKSLRILEILIPYMKKANSCQYDFIDCAWRYGNEAIIGLALKEIKKTDSNFELKLGFQSKVWPSQFAGGIAKSLKFTLQKIGAINTMDCYMLHRPSSSLESNVSAWKQLVDCKRNRLTKKIGLGHFDKDTMELLFSISNHRPDFVQYELSVNNMRYDRIAYCKKNNIEIQATFPLGQYENNMTNQLVKDIAEKHKTSIKSILLAFLLNQSITPIVVPASQDEIESLIKSKEIILDKDDMEKLETLNTYETHQFESVEMELKT